MRHFLKLSFILLLYPLQLFAHTLNAQDSLKIVVERNKQLIIELRNANQQLENCTSNITSLESQVTKLESENGRLESENNRLETENGKLTSENNRLEAENNKLRSENDYFREALALLNSKPVVNGNPITYNITKVYGQEADGKLFIEGIMENKGAQLRYQPKQIQLIDPKGNILNTFKITYGGTHEVGFDFVNNVPINFKIEFEKIPEHFPVIKTLTMSFFDAKLNSVLFKNLNVQWD